MTNELPDTLYFKVEGELLLAVCKAWRERYKIAQDAAFEFYKRHGSEGFFPNLYGDLIGITAQEITPPGWKVLKAKRVGHLDRLVPAKGSAGDIVRGEIEALPKHPRHSEIVDAIGHPCQVSWEASSGRGFSCMGYVFDPVQLVWAGDIFIISCPNAEKYVAQTREQHPGCTITQGEWIIPEGLTPLTKAKVDLIFAQQAVTDEQAA
jgi:hypothetical protein